MIFKQKIHKPLEIVAILILAMIFPFMVIAMIISFSSSYICDVIKNKFKRQKNGII